VLLCRPNLDRTRAGVVACARGGAPRAGAWPCRERPGAGQSGPEWGVLAFVFGAGSGRHRRRRRVRRVGAGFRRVGQVGKLKTWETGNLTCSPVVVPSRISVFQDFRFSPHHCHPRNSAELGGAGIVLNVSFTLKCGRLVTAYSDIHLLLIYRL
jgi:hypothetical protein